jgi:hypothetical protein
MLMRGCGEGVWVRGSGSRNRVAMVNAAATERGNANAKLWP